MMFTEKPSLHAFYKDSAGRDLQIINIGYNDFHHIAPSKNLYTIRNHLVHLVLSGSGTVCIYGKQWQVKPYDLFLIPPDQSMCYYPNAQDPWQYIWVNFTGELSDYYAAFMGFALQQPVVSCPNPEKAYRVVENVFAMLDRGETVSDLAAQAMFLSLADAMNGSQGNQLPTLREQVEAYVSLKYHSPKFTVAEICRDFHISHSGLCKAFRGGAGVKAMITQMRIEEAKRLLRTTDWTVARIGNAVGFFDEIHFYKVFKRLVGLTPGQFRKSQADE